MLKTDFTQCLGSLYVFAMFPCPLHQVNVQGQETEYLKLSP